MFPGYSCFQVISGCHKASWMQACSKVVHTILVHFCNSRKMSLSEMEVGSFGS